MNFLYSKPSAKAPIHKKNNIADMNQSISGMLYLKISVNIDGCNGSKIVLRNRGSGINEKRIILLKSLNKRYMTIPVIRVDNDNKP